MAMSEQNIATDDLVRFITEKLRITPFSNINVRPSSWDLMGQGLAKFKEENAIKKAITCEIDILGGVLMYPWFDDADAEDWCITEKFEEVEGIPLAFWQAWYRMERAGE